MLFLGKKVFDDLYKSSDVTTVVYNAMSPGWPGIKSGLSGESGTIRIAKMASNKERVMIGF